MKLFAVHSPAFGQLWEPFKRSVETRTSFELHAEELPAEFDGVHWGQPKYHELLRRLVERRVKLLEKYPGEVIATSGIDTEFFGDACADLTWRATNFATVDLFGADDNPGPTRLCSCLYVMRPTAALKDLMRAVLDDSRCGLEPDDPILNEKREMVKWQALPHNLYWNTLRPWKSGDPIGRLPSEMLWAHFNYTENLVEKFALAAAVRTQWGVQHGAS